MSDLTKVLKVCSAGNGFNDRFVMIHQEVRRSTARTEGLHHVMICYGKDKVSILQVSNEKTIVKNITDKEVSGMVLDVSLMLANSNNNRVYVINQREDQLGHIFKDWVGEVKEVTGSGEYELNLGNNQIKMNLSSFR